MSFQAASDQTERGTAQSEASSGELSPHVKEIIGIALIFLSLWLSVSMVSYYRPELDGLPEMGLVGKQLWSQSGLKPADIQTAILYDHFTPFTLIQLEELGFCGWGEAKDFIADGAIEIGGRLPINTHGGQLGEAYIHGMNGIAEGVRQLRGTSVNPVPDAEHVLVTAGTGVPTSGLILG